MKIASHNMKLIFIYPSLHKRRVSIQYCNNFLQSAVPDMEFVQNFTLLDFQAKIFSPTISPNFNSFSKEKTQKI